MLQDNHPDIVEFIISKMQNPRILKFIMKNTKDPLIKKNAEEKLKFTPLTRDEVNVFTSAVEWMEERSVHEQETRSDYKYAKQKLEDGGTWSVNNPEFLTGANISVCLTEEFMTAIDKDTDYALRFPDVANYTQEQMVYYNTHWQDCGDVREWETIHHMPVKIHKIIKAKELWQLINICATYAAEPGIFFIDNANEMTNATAYGQKVVATNPCGK